MLILPLKIESIWFSVGLTPIFLGKRGQVIFDFVSLSPFVRRVVCVACLLLVHWTTASFLSTSPVTVDKMCISNTDHVNYKVIFNSFKNFIYWIWPPLFVLFLCTFQHRCQPSACTRNTRCRTIGKIPFIYLNLLELRYFIVACLLSFLDLSHARATPGKK